ncbi:hypothetical protein N7530_011906 [Penicillium desertorum]|uniref:Uncharacterized protein n=1 Tax=Penicillium desertorum TaxID=1303715 RepID=A0A9W9WEK4_9EURO|nr:hypothetical protein N7530_011906 [Penicillium desertorum]
MQSHHPSAPIRRLLDGNTACNPESRNRGTYPETYTVQYANASISAPMTLAQLSQSRRSGETGSGLVTAAKNLPRLEALYPEPVTPNRVTIQSTFCCTDSDGG